MTTVCGSMFPAIPSSGTLQTCHLPRPAWNRRDVIKSMLDVVPEKPPYVVPHRLIRSKKNPENSLVILLHPWGLLGSRSLESRPPDLTGPGPSLLKPPHVGSFASAYIVFVIWESSYSIPKASESQLLST